MTTLHHESWYRELSQTQLKLDMAWMCRHLVSPRQWPAKWGLIMWIVLTSNMATSWIWSGDGDKRVKRKVTEQEEWAPWKEAALLWKVLSAGCLQARWAVLYLAAAGWTCPGYERRVLVACLWRARKDWPEPLLASLSSAAFFCRDIPWGTRRGRHTQTMFAPIPTTHPLIHKSCE